MLQDALIGSLLRLIQRMSSAHKAAEKKEDKGLKKALCPALAIPDDPSVRVSSVLGVNLFLFNMFVTDTIDLSLVSVE